jgi:multisubunit Na+/H+ antiporter MnhC subunit
MLPIDLAEISYEERVFLSRLADIMINTFDPFLQSFSNQLLGIIHAIVISAIVVSFAIGTLRILVIRIDARKT